MAFSTVQLSNPTPREFASAITGATEILEGERKRGTIRNGTVSGGLISLQVPENTAIIGDIHGDLGSLYRILHGIDADRFLANKDNKIVFLGDYIDRGSGSVAVLYTICSLKQAYPDSVVLIRGNHEAPDEFPFNSHDLPQKIEEFVGKDRSKETYSHVLSFFKSLATMVAIDSSLLIVHGGLPVQPVQLDWVHLQSRHVTEEMLWSDPRNVADCDWEPSRRMYGRHFGQAVTERWLKATNTRALVRGHEPCAGYRLDHGGRVLTLFSSKEPYPRFEAGYLVIKGSDLRSIRNAEDLVPHIRLA